MAITDGLLMFIGGLAVLASVGGVFVDFPDRTVSMFLSVLAAILWGTFGLSAYDVLDGQGGHITVEPLVFLGFGLGVLLFINAIYEFLAAFKSEYTSSSIVD